MTDAKADHTGRAVDVEIVTQAPRPRHGRPGPILRV
jgi:hypothetical protein